MKRAVVLVLSLLLLGSVLTGCGKGYEYALFDRKDLTKYITLEEYKGIEVDTGSDEFKASFEKLQQSDVENAGIYEELKEGKVKKGDTANIDYEGKLNGKAFEGGTAKGSDLEIGSNSFIDGFEEGLIGVEVGKTVDLNLTFPKEYPNNPDLAGKKVVFTVKVNYIKTAKEPKDSYKDLGFDTLEAYEADVKDRTVKSFLADAIEENTEVKDYPKEETDFLAEELKKSIEQNIKSQYNMTMDDYYKAAGQTAEEFEQSLRTEQVNPYLEYIMPYYLILDKEDIEITAEDIDKQIKEQIEQSGNTELTVEGVKEEQGVFSFECAVVMDKAMEIVSKNAKIK